MNAHFPGAKLGKKFCLFFSHRFNFIEALSNTGLKPDWKTITAYPIEHRNLWNRFLSPDKLIGLSFGSTTHYALLDIDRGSPYHPYNNEAAFKSLLGAYEDVGFNDHILVRSSSSEGLHVYFPLPKEVPTHKLAVMLKLVAIRGGFALKSSSLEIFPNTKAYNASKATSYKAHRLPLQTGSYLLDRNYDPYSNDIKTFLDLADQAAVAQDYELIENAIEVASQAKAFRYIKGDGGKAAAFANDLQEQITEGWTDYGQTNDLLRLIGTYGRVFEGLEGQELTNYIADRSKNLHGFRKFCRHQHHIDKRAQQWAKCIEKFYYPYGSEPVRVGTFAQMQDIAITQQNLVNLQREQSAVDRIKCGLEYIKKELKEIPKTITGIKEALIAAIRKLFGVRPSDKTLYKYRELWQQELIRKEKSVLQPLTALNENLEPCHTPNNVVQHSDEPANTLQEKSSSEFATPPLYMKVKGWILDQTVLIYQGLNVHNTVSLKGQEKAQLRSISKNQQVVIYDCSHSSFLFRPDVENNLQVYVKPISNDEVWLTGIPVLAKYLTVPP